MKNTIKINWLLNLLIFSLNTVSLSIGLQDVPRLSEPLVRMPYYMFLSYKPEMRIIPMDDDHMVASLLNDIAEGGACPDWLGDPGSWAHAKAVAFFQEKILPKNIEDLTVQDIKDLHKISTTGSEAKGKPGKFRNKLIFIKKFVGEDISTCLLGEGKDDGKAKLEQKEIAFLQKAKSVMGATQPFISFLKGLTPQEYQLLKKAYFLSSADPYEMFNGKWGQASNKGSTIIQDTIKLLMEKFIVDLKAKVKANEHPLSIAFWAHLELFKIHAFDDGNSRTARLVMNFILLKAGFVPVVFYSRELYDKYVTYTEQAGSDASIDFMCRTMILVYDKYMQSIMSESEWRELPIAYLCHVCMKTKQEAQIEKFLLCTRCEGVRYCSKDCQITDWKLWHKAGCPEMCKAKAEKVMYAHGGDIDGALGELAELLKAGGSLGMKTEKKKVGFAATNEPDSGSSEPKKAEKKVNKTKKSKNNDVPNS